MTLQDMAVWPYARPLMCTAAWCGVYSCVFTNYVKQCSMLEPLCSIECLACSSALLSGALCRYVLSNSLPSSMAVQVDRNKALPVH